MFKTIKLNRIRKELTTLLDSLVFYDNKATRYYVDSEFDAIIEISDTYNELTIWVDLISPKLSSSLDIDFLVGVIINYYGKYNYVIYIDGEKYERNSTNKIQ